ncbi:MAG: DUF3667 domain-containing protein [Proteobacteria bacterium]|nr:DUF3667 domain-containing protein [Pseudomonadota bacterium]
MSGELELAAADWFRGLIKRKQQHAAPIGTPCRNCDAILQGLFCHDCGQSSDNHKRSIWHLVWEAFEGLFHLDGRLLHTLPQLFFRPGKLARDYLDGRLARHVPPFRTFLVALLLLIFAAEHAVHELRQDDERRKQAHLAALATPQGRAQESARMRAQADKDRAEALAEAQRDRANDLKTAENDHERAGVERAYQREVAVAESIHTHSMIRADAAARGQVLSAEAVRQLAAKAGEKSAPRRHKDSWYGEGKRKAAANPEYYMAVVFGWAHRLAVLLLPIVGLSLAAVYANRKDLFLYDHLLVAMDLLSFGFLTNALGLVLPQVLWPWWFGLLALWTPVNLFQTLRGAYGSSVLGAVSKTLVVWTLSGLTFAILVTALLVFSLTQL